MQAFQDEVKTLTQLGLTFCEAKVYLALAHSGMCSAKTISKASKVSKPDVYRVLAALQERGVIEKAISTPALFEAIPLEQSLSILFKRKETEYNILREKTEQLLRNFKNNQSEQALRGGEHQFILIPEKGAELERRRKETKAAEKSIDVINSWKRFPKTLFVYAEETIEALQRGVGFRTITEKPEDEKRLPKFVMDFRKAGSYRLKYILNPPTAILSIYDKKEALITTSPSADLGEMATLWTNNPSLVTVMQDYFEVLWAKAVQNEN